LSQVEKIGFEVWIAPVTRGGALLAFCHDAKPFRLIAGMNSGSQQQISVIRVPAIFPKIDLPGLARGKKVFLVLQPCPQLAAQIPRIKKRGFLAQPVIQQSSARWGGHLLNSRNFTADGGGFFLRANYPRHDEDEGRNG